MTIPTDQTIFPENDPMNLIDRLSSRKAGGRESLLTPHKVGNLVRTRANRSPRNRTENKY